MSSIADASPVISVRDLGVRYKRSGSLFRPARYYQVFEGISFELYRGETLGIVGHNGAGKSTLLRALAGIIQPDSGTVINHGVTVSLLALQAGFDGELPGTDNAVLSAMLLGYTRRQARERLPGIAEFAELGEFMHEPVKTYSSGMRARLGFSVAMHLTPDVLLLDEVLAVGDKHFRKKAEREMLKKMHSDQTIVFVSHSEQQVQRLCDRVFDFDRL
ncbi:ABC transporter ATP-binding protein [Alloalcanivorax sp. C16-2]|uniref:ABC transporter ATP-binding protein n=1 Tax=Alloalcanivorax TaxID=3020832 RepID=UPI0019322638|nr:ABC transporter ATP-binding protein [Alloalcanivorax marinus]MBL7250152.1 ABC transporter ATP-binding protein [Alloalcanivorax marinus]